MLMKVTTMLASQHNTTKKKKKKKKKKKTEGKVASHEAGDQNARILQQQKIYQHQNTRLGTDSSINHWKWTGLKPVFLVLNITLNSDAALNYKYMFCPRMGSLPHL